MATVNDYLNLITSAFRQKPNFIKMVTLNVSVQVRVQELLAEMIPLFDVDTATGDQLDIIGQWVGISRNVSIPINNVYFSWDSADYTQGWDFGSWPPSSAPTTVTSLPDDSYRVLIKAKIASNHWDGTIEGAYNVWEEVFTNFTILIQDNQDMSYALAIVGGIVDSLTLALIVGGYIPLKPEGVRVSKYLIPVNSGPLFGWDIENEYIKGYDQGSWAKEITT